MLSLTMRGLSDVNISQKRLLLELVAERRRHLDDSRRLALAAFSPAHPVVGRLAQEIASLDGVASAVARSAA